MKRLIVGLSSAPALLAFAASVVLMAQGVVILGGVCAAVVTVAGAGPLLAFAHSRGRRLWPVLAGALASLALITSVVTTHWPLRVAYTLSRPSLEAVAQDVRAGRPFAGPTRAGLFRIAETEVRR